MSSLIELVLNAGVSLGVVAGLTYRGRDLIASFFTKAVEAKFERRIETIKSELRQSEKELDDIRSFVTTVRSSNETILHSKRLDAAETLLRARQVVSQLAMLTEFMKIINISEIKKRSNDKQISKWMAAMLQPFDVDDKLNQIGGFDVTIPSLYLSDRTLKLFNTYRSIVIHAAIFIKFYSMEFDDRPNLFDEGAIEKMVVEIIPTSKSGFEAYGSSYAFQWVTYLYDELLNALRKEVSGIDYSSSTAKLAASAALDARIAQMEALGHLKKIGVPNELIQISGTK